MHLHRLLGLVLAGSLAASACHAPAPAQFHVVGVERAPAKAVLFVQVVNQARRPMRLQRLQYTFGAAGAVPSHGEVRLQREIAAGSAAVVEVPVDLLEGTHGPLTLAGRLYATLDEIERSFEVSAVVNADESATRVPVGGASDVAEPASDAPASE